MIKILLDTCVWGGAVQPLQTSGYDVEWAGEWSPDPGDAEILNYAHREKRILVTLDKDFGELAILKGQPHSGIIRLFGFRVIAMANVISRLVQRHDAELALGAVIVATPNRVRIRPQR